MSSYPPPLPDIYRDQAVGEAQAWVARFAPLVMEDNVLTEAEVRHRLETIHQLRGVGPALRDRLTSVGGPDHQELVGTLHSAVEQLDDVERDLRIRLASLAPGDPLGIVDLDQLQDRLAERAARTEVGVTDIPSKLDMKVSAGSWAAAGFLGLFSFGWNSFTAVHATLMIGGMYQSFGWPAFFMLGFYAIFFTVGIGMMIAALNAASSESIELNGHDLTVKRKLGFWERRKSYRLGPDSKAEISIHGDPGIQPANKRSPKPTVVLSDMEGRMVTIGSNAAPPHQKLVADKINAYLESQPRY